MVIGIDASRAFVPQKTGSENYSANLISALAAIDKKNNYRFYIKTQNSLPRQSYGASATKLKTQNWPNNFKFVEIKLPRLWTQLGLAFECLIHPPDILFIPAHTLPVIRRPNLKTVVTIHDLGAEFLPGFHTFPQKLYLNFSTKYAVKNATAMIAVSESTKKDLISKFGADPKKISVVYHGINREKFKIKSADKASLQRSGKLKIEKILAKYRIRKPYILFVGTIQPRKNLERLIEAFAKVVSRLQTTGYSEKRTVDGRQSTVDLIIVGKLGWLYDEILSAPKKFKVLGKVKFLDYVKDSDLPYLYSGASLFVLPSLVEGFGLPVLEAMAAGIPLAVSARSSLPEVGGNAAIYFNPEDSRDIANIIFQVLTNPKLRKDLIEKGKKQLTKFSWEKCARETLNVLGSIVSSSK